MKVFTCGFLTRDHYATRELIADKVMTPNGYGWVESRELDGKTLHKFEHIVTRNVTYVREFNLITE